VGLKWQIFCSIIRFIFFEKHPKQNIASSFFFWDHKFTLFSSKLLFFSFKILIDLSFFICILVNSIKTTEISSKRSLRQLLWSTRKSPLRKSPSSSRKTNLSTLTRNEHKIFKIRLYEQCVAINHRNVLSCVYSTCESFYLNTINIFATLDLYEITASIWAKVLF